MKISTSPYLTELILCIKTYRLGISLTTLLFMTIGMCYYVYLYNQYKQRTVYQGSIHLKLGAYTYIDKKNRHITKEINDLDHLRAFLKEQYKDVLNINYYVRSNYSKEKDKRTLYLYTNSEYIDTIKERLNRVRKLIQNKEFRTYQAILKTNDKTIIAFQSMKTMKPIQVIVKPFSLNSYFILSCILLGSITSVCLACIFSRINR